MKLPYAERAVVDIRKLRNYCLDSEHPTGKHKATLFRSALGMTIENAEELRKILLYEITRNEASLGRLDNYGQRYRVDFELDWNKKKATILSSWIIERDSDTPRLISCYPI